jgi:hypothetical protein
MHTLPSPLLFLLRHRVKRTTTRPKEKRDEEEECEQANKQQNGLNFEECKDGANDCND